MRQKPLSKLVPLCWIYGPNGPSVTNVPGFEAEESKTVTQFPALPDPVLTDGMDQVGLGVSHGFDQKLDLFDDLTGQLWVVELTVQGRSTEIITFIWQPQVSDSGSRITNQYSFDRGQTTSFILSGPVDSNHRTYWIRSNFALYTCRVGTRRSVTPREANPVAQRDKTSSRTTFQASECRMSECRMRPSGHNGVVRQQDDDRETCSSENDRWFSTFPGFRKSPRQRQGMTWKWVPQGLSWWMLVAKHWFWMILIHFGGIMTTHMGMVVRLSGYPKKCFRVS